MERRNDFDDVVEVMDLYLACYYVLRGCTIEKVTCIPTGKSLSCSVIVKGNFDLVHEIQEEYFEKKATVNLWDFRSAYCQVNSYIHQAKRSSERDHRRGADASPREGGAL